MHIKILFSIVAVQTAVILGLVFLIWQQGANTDVELLSELTLGLIGLFAVSTFFLALTQQNKSKHIPEQGIRHQGLVKWFNPTKGFGFIEQDNGQDLFVHQSEIRHSGFRYLNKGDRVEYQIGTGKKGPVALNVFRTHAAEETQLDSQRPASVSRAS